VCFTEDVLPPQEAELARGTDLPFQGTLLVSSRNGWATALEEIANRIGAGTKYVAVAKRGHEPLGRAWPWEAIRLHELHSDVAVVSGRALDERGTVLDAGKRAGRWATATNNFLGLNRLDPGAFALALKPHSIEQPCEALLIIDTEFLQSAIHVARTEISSSLSQLFATAARLYRRRIVYTPLIEAAAARAVATMADRRSATRPSDVAAAVPL
jgi:hypothetical protein